MVELQVLGGHFRPLETLFVNLSLTLKIQGLFPFMLGHLRSEVTLIAHQHILRYEALLLLLLFFFF